MGEETKASDAGDQARWIRIHGAREHNLRDLDVELPRGALSVIEGVSGSGKSSLAFDLLHREAERRYLRSFPSYARHFAGKMERPRCDGVSGLSASLALDQKSCVRSPRSTVGTLSGLHDPLRLLFARVGRPRCPGCGHEPERVLDRAKEGECSECGRARPALLARLFSFNTPFGACSNCRGLGLEEEVDPELLVKDAKLSLREGAMVPTTPKPYIVYSQVTMEALDTVCQAHGFSVDTPWCELDEEQRAVIFFGSKRVKVPFGKHSLESRMKWSGITARPRELGHYRGLVPVIAETLEKKRNENILRFVRSHPCTACHGSRLNEDARSVRFAGLTLDAVLTLPLEEIADQLSCDGLTDEERPVAEAILGRIRERSKLLTRLGLGHLHCARESTTLSGGEAQRLRLGTRALSDLGGILYVADEPTAGVHPGEVERVIEVLEGLVKGGNTVVVVEHEERVRRRAQWLLRLGPGAGRDGGRRLHCGPPENTALPPFRPRSSADGATSEWLEVLGAEENNLRGIDVRFRKRALNLVCGLSGAGKSTLAEGILARALRRDLQGAKARPGRHRDLVGAEDIEKLVLVSQRPAALVQRSQVATLAGLYDALRSAFARLPAAKSAGLGAGAFSINKKGAGRCERCEGNGYELIGMHDLADVALPCPACEGRRFAPRILAVEHRGRSMADVLDASVDEVRELFDEVPALVRGLDALKSVGLGYLSLGQPAATLSGGEAQRIKLAAQLARPRGAHTLFVLDEATRGLHHEDVERLADALEALVDAGHSVIAVDHREELLARATWVVELGPRGGDAGGELVFQGTPEELLRCEDSPTGRALRDRSLPEERVSEPKPARSETLRFTAPRTHNLRMDAASFPRERLSVVTGVSGSGKSSLAFATLGSATQGRFTEAFPTHLRRFVGMGMEAGFDSATGLVPGISVSQRASSSAPRSTVGTWSECFALLRLLASRCGEMRCDLCEGELDAGRCALCDRTPQPPRSARDFGFNHSAGACPQCDGRGRVMRCVPERLISHPSRSLLEGALDGDSVGRFFGDPKGQHVATLAAAARDAGFDLEAPAEELDEDALRFAFEGDPERSVEVLWEHGVEAEGNHRFVGRWIGFARLVEDEFQKRSEKRRAAMAGLLEESACRACDGTRLRAGVRVHRLEGRSFGEWSGVSLEDLHCCAARHARDARKDGAPRSLVIGQQAWEELERRSEAFLRLGIGHLELSRPLATLSRGEFTRLRLGSALGAGLRDLCYVFDEPTRGLHPEEVQGVLACLRTLRDGGNTVVVVEHERSIVEAADHLIDLGPGAGIHGGTIVAEGTPAEVVDRGEGATAAWLRSELRRPEKGARVIGETLRLVDVRARHLKGFDLDLSLGGLVVIAGVSGSGKSTLLDEVLRPSLLAREAVGCARATFPAGLQEVCSFGGASEGTSGRASVATTLGLFDRLRTLWAATPEAKAAGLRKAAFTLDPRKGGCEACGGLGEIEVALDFLPSLRVPCERCRGRRFRADRLACSLEGLAPDELLASSLEVVAERFAEDATLGPAARLAVEVGLGHLQLGQGTRSLSGGERQRVELVARLRRRAKGSVLLLDEVSAGLHEADVLRLLGLFDRLVDKGHGLVVVDHHPALLAHADRVIELGPVAGADGGELIAEGTPEELARLDTPTGRVLRRRFEREAEGSAR